MGQVIADRVEVDSNRSHGKPVIAGSRVLVRTVLGALAAGDSPNAWPRRMGLPNRTFGPPSRFPANSSAIGTTHHFGGNPCVS